MTAELENLLENTYKLRKTLQQALPPEAVDYLIGLIAKDGAHRKYLKIVEETNDESV